MAEIVYLGNSAFGIGSGETSLLVDPFISENGECPWDVEETVERIDPDAVCVTHAAFDHFGDTLTLATEYDLPVITEPATAHSLRSNGVDEDLITVMVWGMEASVGEIDIRALEARHVSCTVVAGTLVTGLPLSFLIRCDDTTVYHMGDTSIFGDLERFAERYHPDVVLIGVGQAYDAASRSTGPVVQNIHELTIDEATTISKWFDGGRIVPMHYLPEERELFVEAMAADPDAPPVVPLDPGDSVHLG